MGGFGVKPGRSQSVFQAFAAVIFGCICIGMASVTGGARAPGIFVIVPIAMALLAFIAAGFSVYNAVSTNRMSSFEVMDLADEPDPLSRRRQIAPESEYNHIRASESLKKLYDAGVPIHVGGHGQMAGMAAHWEIWSFVQGGMSEHEALKCATILGAKHVGFGDDLGSIEEGKLADLIVLDENPLEDIQNTTSVRYTVLNGRVYDAATMDQVYPDADSAVSTHLQHRAERGWGWDYAGPTLTVDHGSCRGCGHPGMATHLMAPEHR